MQMQERADVTLPRRQVRIAKFAVDGLPLADMSQVLINQYLAQLDVLKKVGGTQRESSVREAFKDLLKGWGRQHDLVFIHECRLDTATKDIRTVDGALLHELRVPVGNWEAKDEKDDIDAEIAFKFKRGYPQDKVIFEDSTQAVLIQHREEVMRRDARHPAESRTGIGSPAWHAGECLLTRVLACLPAEPHLMRVADRTGSR